MFGSPPIYDAEFRSRFRSFNAIRDDYLSEDGQPVEDKTRRGKMRRESGEKSGQSGAGESGGAMKKLSSSMLGCDVVQKRRRFDGGLRDRGWIGGEGEGWWRGEGERERRERGERGVGGAKVRGRAMSGAWERTANKSGRRGLGGWKRAGGSEEVWEEHDSEDDNRE